MDGRIDPHGNFVGIFPGNLLVHVKQVTVFFFYCGFTKSSYFLWRRIMDVIFVSFWNPVSLDGWGIIQVNGKSRGAYPVPRIAAHLDSAGSDVPRHQVSKGMISSFEVIITFILRDISWCAIIIFPFGHPNPSVISEGFRHQCQFGLMVA